MSKHFTEADRAVLAELLTRKVCTSEIASRFEVVPSTVYRELGRNTGPVGYIYQEAQQRTDARRTFRARVRKMDRPELREFVCRGLKAHWSPEQIAGRSRLAFPNQPDYHISRQTIYDWIAREEQRGRDEWRKCLRFGRPRRKRAENAGRLPAAVSIEGRPRVVDQRKRYGDWEGDTIVSRGHRGGLVSLVERKSGYLLLERVNRLQAAAVRMSAQHQLEPLPRSLLRTITFDNGKEFAEHEALAQATGLKIYFARPYCAWERGTNENTNGLVRQYLPKGTDLTAVSHRAVAAIQSSLNDRPRRRLGYKTPREILATQLARQRVAFEP
jgi:IS30 family transposase